MERLRKFGLVHCDLPSMIDNIAFLLRISLVNIEKTYSKRLPLIYYVITILTGASYFYIYHGSMIWFVFIRCPETGDLVAATVIFSLAACSMSGVTKLIYMRIYNETVKNIVDEYLVFDATMERGTRFYTNLLKTLLYVKRRAVLFSLYLSLNGIFYIVIAISKPGRHLPEDLMVVYGFEPMYETPNYEIAFIMMTAGVYYAIKAETNTCAFIMILAGYAEALLLALGGELENLWDDANAFYEAKARTRGIEDDANRNKITNEYIRNKLRDVVTKHKMCIYLVGQVENMFRGAMTVQFCCVTSGLISELLGGLENTYIQLPYTLLQLTMDCSIGQRLIDASLVLENAVYCCKWENFDKGNQRTVYLMLLNSQKSLKLSVGGLRVLSFTCLMSVLKSIYSAYTALRSKM